MNAPNTTPGPWAFPIAVPGDHYHVDQGMALRDWFAGQMAAAALVNATGITEEVANEAWPLVARLSYKMADALLAERERGEVQS